MTIIPPTEKMKKLWRKLLEAWVKRKNKKAVKLQHKLLKEELKQKS